jgi:hypothetical protein
MGRGSLWQIRPEIDKSQNSTRGVTPVSINVVVATFCSRHDGETMKLNTLAGGCVVYDTGVYPFCAASNVLNQKIAATAMRKITPSLGIAFALFSIIKSESS